jgi:hypothetical protein
VATRKQRRRREKEARHEYEIVYVDDEGNEVEPDEAAVRAPAPRSAPARAKSGKSSQSSRRAGRTPQPPSWRRVIKRGAIFAPIFFATVLLIGGKHVSFAQALVQSVLLLVLFVPFSYFLDTMVWRSHQKRLAGGSTAKR